MPRRPAVPTGPGGVRAPPSIPPYVPLGHPGPGLDAAATARAPVYAERFDGWTSAEPAAPHRHDYHAVLWGVAGAGCHRVDGRTAELAAGRVALIARGQVHAFQHTSALGGYAVAFTDDLFAADTPPAAEAAALFNYLDGEQTWALPPAAHAFGVQLLEALVAARADSALAGVGVLRGLVAALLAHVAHATGAHGGGVAGGIAGAAADASGLAGGPALVPAFVRLVEQHHRARHDVAFYARALGCTPGHLGRMLRAVRGRSPKRLVADRLALEARRLLAFTDLPVKHVAAALGYADAFHFSKAFRAAVGVSPQHFRAREPAAPPPRAARG